MRASSGQVSGMRLKSSKIVVASDCLQNLSKAMNDWRYRRVKTVNLPFSLMQKQ